MVGTWIPPTVGVRSGVTGYMGQGLVRRRRHDPEPYY